VDKLDHNEFPEVMGYADLAEGIIGNLDAAYAEGMLKNEILTRAGFDKSYLARQLEGYADIYMSRVSNLLYQTPFAYRRFTRSSLPHDGGIVGGPHEWKK
jgi:hypothetical protein